MGGGACKVPSNQTILWLYFSLNLPLSNRTKIIKSMFFFKKTNHPWFNEKGFNKLFKHSWNLKGTCFKSLEILLLHNTHFLNLWKYMLCTTVPFWSLQFPKEKTKCSISSFDYFGQKNVCAWLNRCNWRTKWMLNFNCTSRLNAVFFPEEENVFLRYK